MSAGSCDRRVRGSRAHTMSCYEDEHAEKTSWKSLHAMQCGILPGLCQTRQNTFFPFKLCSFTLFSKFISNSFTCSESLSVRAAVSAQFYNLWHACSKHTLQTLLRRLQNQLVGNSSLLFLKPLACLLETRCFIAKKTHDSRPDSLAGSFQNSWNMSLLFLGTFWHACWKHTLQTLICFVFCKTNSRETCDCCS